MYQITDLRGLLYGLHAIVRLHTVQEDETYLSLGDSTDAATATGTWKEPAMASNRSELPAPRAPRRVRPAAQTIVDSVSDSSRPAGAAAAAGPEAAGRADV